jgi:ribosomal protein S11
MSQSIAMSVGVSNTPSPVAVNLASAANVYGIFLNNITPTNGGFDSESWAYSANLLGPSVSALGVPFYFGAPGVADAVASVTVPLPAGNFQTLNLAGAAVNGSQASQSFVVTYTDNSTSTFTQSVSDWCGPQNYAGETLALAMTYRISPSSGTSALACNVYAYSFALAAGKTAASVTLPSNRNVVMLAITLSQNAAPAPQAQTITFNSIPSQVVGGTLTVNATASSGLPVSFSIVQNGNCSISGNVVTFLNAGNCGVIANQGGNSAYSAAPAVGQIVVVNNPTAQTITFAAPASQAAGTTVALSATASSGLSVSFSSSTTSICTVSGSTATLLAGGTCAIVASQPGNNVYSAATPVTQSFTVTPASGLKSQTITFNSITSQVVGGTLTVSATASSGLPVSFSIVQNGNCGISGNVVTFLNVGNCGVIANQAGNSAYSAAPAVGQIVVVNAPKAPTLKSQTITFNAIPAQILGRRLTLSATASSGLAVSFSIVQNGTCSISGNVVTFSNIGTCSVTANQAGNSVYAAAPAVKQNIVVNF